MTSSNCVLGFDQMGQKGLTSALQPGLQSVHQATAAARLFGVHQARTTAMGALRPWSRTGQTVPETDANGHFMG